MAGLGVFDPNGDQLGRVRDAVATLRVGRRRAVLNQVDWNEVDGLSATQSGQGAESLLAVLAGLRPADLAAQLQDMPDKRQLEVAEALDDERLADVLEELPEEDQINI